MGVTRSPIRSALSCLICGTPGSVRNIELDHIKPRSTHPQLIDDPENLAPLCAGPGSCHEKKSLGELRTYVEHRDDWLRYWWSTDKDESYVHMVAVRVNKRYGCLEAIDELRDSDHDDQEATGDSGSGGRREDRGRDAGEVEVRSASNDGSNQDDPSPLTLTLTGIRADAEFTRDDFRRAIQQVKTVEVGRQFRVGDLINLGERYDDILVQEFFTPEWKTECETCVGDGQICPVWVADSVEHDPETCTEPTISCPDCPPSRQNPMTYATMQNYARVSKAIPISRRREGVAFNRHSAAYTLEPDVCDELLLKCEQENWSLDRTRDEVALIKGITRVNATTWTMEKLREKWLEFGCGDDVADFLDELEGEDD